MLLALAAPLWAQTSPQTTLDWHHLGGYSIEQGLAAPAGGRVDAVWFAGTQLLARTASGQIFQTADFETWQAVKAAEPKFSATDAAHLPEPGATARSLPADSGHIYALGDNLYRSEDGGVSWHNLTAFEGRSVVGGGLTGVAVSALDPQHLAVSNRYGVWHSTDGGLSWAGLNDTLPNLPVNALLAPAEGATLPRIEAPDGWAQLSPARDRWLLQNDAAASDQADRSRYGALLKAEITAAGARGENVYAGSSDGRIWFSRDGGATFSESARLLAAGRVERFFVDPDAPRIALAAAGGRVLQTANGGLFWNDITGNLPEARVHGVSADREGSAVYVATDQGLFWARADLNAATPPAAWTALSAGLPTPRAVDVRLENNNNQLFAALEGYGVYAVPAPHRAHVWRVVNAADLSQRAAAPGSLLSIQGGKVQSARAGDLTFPVLAAAVSGSQIQVPFEATGAALALNMESDSRRVTLGFPLKTLSPAIFIGSDGAPVLVDADTGLTLDAANTAHSGARIQVLMTGLGKVRPEWPTGVPAPPANPPAVAAGVQAFLDGTAITVTRATLAPGYVGCYLVEVEIPAIVNAGPAELYITTEGERSNKVTIHLER